MQGVIHKIEITLANGGGLSAKLIHLCPWPLDEDLVVLIGVSKVSTRPLVCTGYGAFLLII